MAEVILTGVNKWYDGQVHAVKDVNLHAQDREFMVFVGPSGCGKTTTLRMVAGLEEISSGEIRIGNRVVNDLPPMDRDIAMVFQNYALYPHKSVYDNMAFGLQMRKFPKEEIEKRVRDAATILGIESLLQRKPRQLSGGQRQRVALGRAIVRHPQLFLFDEPLSNLDAKLRVETRAELARLHRRLGATVVYVTHDQEEAMTLGTRVAVMRDGFLQQVAPPMELYRRPANRFVAGFIGSPGMNFLPGDIMAGRAAAPGPGLTLGIRPHDVTIVARGTGDLDAWVDVVEARGSELLVYLRLGAKGDGPELRVVAPPETSVEPEQTTGVVFDRERLHWFEGHAGQRVLK